jgi:hypothetical protein
MFIVLANKSAEVQRLKRDKPFLTFALILVASGFVFKMFGSLLVFLFSVCLPLTSMTHFFTENTQETNLSYFFKVIFVHAVLRTRSLNNKLANKVEMIGWARTPMGFILEQLGATNEIAS